MRHGMRIAVLLLVAGLFPGIVPAAETPMEAFGALAVGVWENEDSRHVFEWGVGRKAVRSRSYFKVDGAWSLVSEGLWFWDPGQEQLRGIAIATGMPVELFEYTSEIRGTEIVSDLTAQGAAGGKYVERWKFEGGGYEWALENPADGQRMMGGAYRRIDKP